MWLYLHWNIVSLNLFKIVFIPSSLWSSVCFLKLTRITDSCYNSAQAAVRQRSGTMFPLQQHSRGKSREIQFVFTQQLVCKGKPTLLTFRFTLNQRRNKMTFFQATRKRDVFIVSLWTKASISETFFFFYKIPYLCQLRTPIHVSCFLKILKQWSALMFYSTALAKWDGSCSPSKN